MSMFQKAVKHSGLKARIGLVGPAGSGKTKTALLLAQGLGDQIALIDTERESASLYADQFDFDTVALTSFHPDRYIEVIRGAEQAGYDVLVIDSLSHAWMGKDGVLEYKEKIGSDFSAWRKATPLHNKLVDAILDAKLHIIVTMRAKTEYVMEEYLDNGRKKTKPIKVGLQPVQRDGLDYEFTITGDLDHEHNLIISKTRMDALADQVFSKPGPELGRMIRAWLTSGTPQVEQPKPLTGAEKRQKAIDLYRQWLDECIRSRVDVPVAISALDLDTAKGKQIYDAAMTLKALAEGATEDELGDLDNGATQ